MYWTLSFCRTARCNASASKEKGFDSLSSNFGPMMKRLEASWELNMMAEGHICPG